MLEVAATIPHQQLSDLSIDVDETSEIFSKFKGKEVASGNAHIKDQLVPEQEEEGRTPPTEESRRQDEARLAAPVELKKGFLRSFLKKKTVDTVPAEPNKSNVQPMPPSGVELPPKEQDEKEILKGDTATEEQEPSDLAAPIALKKKKRGLFRSFRRSKSKKALAVKLSDLTEYKNNNIEDILNEKLQNYLAEIGVNPSQTEKERLEKSQEKGSFWAELFHFPISLFETIEEDTPQTGDDSDFVFLGFCLTFPQFIGQYIERDCQGLRAVGEDIKAEFNKEEEVSKLQNNFLRLNPSVVDEVSDSEEHELEQTETFEYHELFEQVDTMEEEESEKTETMNSEYKEEQELELAETVEDQELEQVDTIDEKELDPTETMNSEYKEEEFAEEEDELSAAITAENDEEEDVESMKSGKSGKRG
jgi:hypothetical protein